MGIFQEYELLILEIQKEIDLGAIIVSVKIKENLKKEIVINSVIYFLFKINSILKGSGLRCISKYIIVLITIYNIKSQPAINFRPFDWVLYKAAGSITSFTEGYTFIYIGTSKGGLKRFNLFGNYFDTPITTAQGLESNNITASHFDKKTGFLWVSTFDHIQYSFSREGDWFSHTLKSIGLSKFDKIYQIGSTENYIWLKARSSYVKLDHSSGIMIGIYPMPDEINIEWSSGEDYIGNNQLTNIFQNYTFLDGWILNGDELIDRIGRSMNITTSFIGQHGNVYIGSEDGTVFYGTKTMETFTALRPDIINDDVLSLDLKDNYLWIGSQNFLTSKGISKLDIKSLESFSYTFEETINMQPTSIYSIYDSGSEIWAGGDGAILYFNKNKKFWKTLDESRGIPSGIIWDLCITDQHLWMGSSRGLRRLEIATQSVDQIGIEKYFDHTQIYSIENIDNEIWIGSKSGLFIYSNNNPKLMNALNFQKKEILSDFYNISAIEMYGNEVFVASDMGIAKFSIHLKEWELISSAGIYGHEMVYSMANNEKYLFLGTRKGLSRINKNSGLIRDYHFTFIGQVNDIILDDNIIWLGTINGLLRFKWKRDL